MARPRAGVTSRPISQVSAALRVVAATRAAAVILPAVDRRSAGLQCRRGGVVQSGAGRTALGLTGRAVVVAGPPRGVVVGGSPAVTSDPVGPPGTLCRGVVPTARGQRPAGEETQCLGVHGRARVVAQRGVGSRGSTRVVGPHGEGDSMLGEGVVVWARIRLGMQEALAVLWRLLESASLRLAFCPCGAQHYSKSTICNAY